MENKQKNNITKYANVVPTRVENRADTNVSFDDILLSAFLNNPIITKQIAMNIPSLNAAIGFVADMVSITPLKLYKEVNGKVEEVKDDPRVSLFNDDPKDTLDRVQFFRALIYDYYLTKGGYAYLNRQQGNIKSVHYVNSDYVSIQTNNDPIFKDYNLYVNGRSYYPFDFLKILRNTKDGSRGHSILEESPYLLSVVWNMLLFENSLAKKGGAKDCFLESEHELSQEAINEIQAAWKQQFSTLDQATAIVLNDGIRHIPATSSSVELQMNENKVTNSSEICKLVRINEKVLYGNATADDIRNSITTGVLPVLYAIQNAMNRDVLMEKEKLNMYWAFDITEITKGDIKSRYEAYEVGLRAGFLQVDEVRYKEDLDPLNFNYIKLNLSDVFFNPKTREVYTPNTNQTVSLEGTSKNEDTEKGGET